jgi:anti-sigma B factor antagonist
VSQIRPQRIASVQITFSPDYAVAALGGALSEPYAGAIREQLRAVVLGGQRFVLVDLTAVSDIDSRGLGAIISLVKLARERAGEVRCCGAQPFVAEVLSLTRLDRILDCYADQAAALAPRWRASPLVAGDGDHDIH